MIRKDRNYTYLSTTTGMCRSCRRLGPSRIFEQGGKVYQERICSRCGKSKALIAGNSDWYTRMMCIPIRPRYKDFPRSPVRQGCPHDCGPCDFHEGCCNLPVFSVTNACNMRCPICFTYNREDSLYFMTREEIRSIIDNVIRMSAPLDLINITGGEPTLHPDIIALLEECKRSEIGRVTMNSNGLRLGEDEELCRQLADLGIYVILSFNTLRPETSVKIHGKDVVAQKLTALHNLEKCGIGTTLLNVMIRGINDHEIGDIIRLATERENVRSITVQTMTYTGRGGGNFLPRNHMPVDDAAMAVERYTQGRIRAPDFFPLPAAHPLCYSIAYFIRNGSDLISFTTIFEREELARLMGRGYLMQPLDEHADLFTGAIDRLWARGVDGHTLKVLREAVATIYPSGGNLSYLERQRAAEKLLLTVYLHAHMDEDTFDVSRVGVCPDQVPDTDGRMIPACAYNLFYRMKDSRFWLG